MANAGNNIKKRITKILEEDNLSASEILGKMVDMGYRNTPTLAQLNSILGKGPNYIKICMSSVTSKTNKQYEVTIWGLKEDES